MAGSRSKRNNPSVIALIIGLIVATAACGVFTVSWLVLRDGEAERALWLLGTGFLLLLSGGILIAVGVINYDRTMFFGGDVSPVGLAKYSPGPGTPAKGIQALSEAQSNGEGVSGGSQADVEEPTGPVRPLDGGAGR